MFFESIFDSLSPLFGNEETYTDEKGFNVNVPVYNKDGEIEVDVDPETRVLTITIKSETDNDFKSKTLACYIPDGFSLEYDKEFDGKSFNAIFPRVTDEKCVNTGKKCKCKKRIRELEAEVDRLRDALITKESENEELRAQISELQGKIEGIRNSLF